MAWATACSESFEPSVASRMFVYTMVLSMKQGLSGGGPLAQFAVRWRMVRESGHLFQCSAHQRAALGLEALEAFEVAHHACGHLRVDRVQRDRLLDHQGVAG